MTTRCPNCQTANSADSRFCLQCGSALPAIWAPPSAEELARRALTPPPPASPSAIGSLPAAPPAWGPPATPGPQALPPLPYATAPATPPGPYPAVRPVRQATRSPLAVALIAAGAAVLLVALGLLVMSLLTMGK